MNKITDLLLLLSCPDDGHDIVLISENQLSCSYCNRKYNFENGILKILPSKKTALPPVYQNEDYIKWQSIFPGVFESRGIFHKIIDESTHRWIAKIFNKQKISDKEWVLDLGCGIGDHFKYFKRLNNVIGFDINEIALLKCREKYKEIILLQGDLYSLPFKNEVLVHVMMLHVLEHMYYLDKALIETERILNKEGFLYMGLPCEGGWLRDTLRAITTSKINSRKYNMDYDKVSKIEHCNDTYKLIDVLGQKFTMLKKRFFPFNLLNCVGVNLTLSMKLQRKC